MKQAIITGDIILSTQMSAEKREWLLWHLQNALAQWDSDYKSRSEIFRGDSFQCYIPNTSEALSYMVLIKSYIRSLSYSKVNKSKMNSLESDFDVRVALGIGAKGKLNKRLAISSGKAFELSGLLLDSLKYKKQSFAIITDDPYQEELQTESLLLDHILSHTTTLQCEVVVLKLLGYTEIEISERLNIGQSAVNQRSNSAGWPAIDVMLKRFESIYGQPRNTHLLYSRTR